MSYHAHTFTMMCPRAILPADGVIRDGRAFADAIGKDGWRGVSTASRNNVLLLYHFKRIYEASRRPAIAHLTAGLSPDATWAGDRYFVLADDEALRVAADGVAALLDDVRLRPAFVADALREPDRTGPGQVMLGATGEKVADVQFVVTSDEDRLIDGWYYPYFDHEIPPLVDAAVAITDGQLRSPEPDDEGESLGYLFAFLKSQRAVITHARETAQACVFLDWR